MRTRKCTCLAGRGYGGCLPVCVAPQSLSDEAGARNTRTQFENKDNTPTEVGEIMLFQYRIHPNYNPV